jgi:mannose-6-phosphate isomerase-like protein (cupin superfamily)/quinol monooxygenase YgiN
MTQVARYGRSVAHPGRGGELAQRLLAAAAELELDAGCELYLVNHERGDPDAVWVTELWRSQADLDAALAKLADGPDVAAVKELVERWEMVELELLGGKGPAASQATADGAAPYTVHRLTETDDSAARFGLGETGEARFPANDLAAAQTGLAHYRIRPGRRQTFGHRHERVEEVYVVLSGSGRVKLDDEIVQIAALDSIRVAPPVVRCFEAGSDGLELLAFGPHRKGDGELLHGWWSD